MTYILLIFIAVAAFVLGYFLGNLDEPPMQEIIHIKIDEDFDNERREYENFLNYDGSDQS